MDFFSTIYLSKDDPLLWRIAENYLDITNSSFTVSQINGRTISLKENDQSVSGWVTRAIKMISFVTVLPPIVALVVRYIYRSTHSFKVVYSEVKVTKELEVWKKVYEQQNVKNKKSDSSLRELFGSCIEDYDPSEIEAMLSSKETFRDSCPQVNKLVASAMKKLINNPKDAEALASAKKVYKGIADFLRKNTDKKLFELYDIERSCSKDVDSFEFRCHFLQDFDISRENFDNLWQLMKNLRKQIKYTEKQAKIQQKVKASSHKSSLPLSNLSWLHGTKAIVLKLACAKTSQKILPSGKLQQKKSSIVTGEMREGSAANGINQVAISGTGLLKGEMALSYAKSYLLNVEESHDLYKKLLAKKDSFITKNTGNFACFLDDGTFSQTVQAVKIIHDLKNEEFKKDLPEWKKLLETVKSELHLYVFLARPLEIFKQKENHYRQQFYNFISSLEKLQELIDNPESSTFFSEEDMELSKIPLVLGSMTRCGAPCRSNMGDDVGEENIFGSMKLGKDIQMVFTPNEHIAKVKKILEEYSLSSVRVEDMESLRSAVELDKELAAYFYDVYNKKKWRKMLYPR